MPSAYHTAYYRCNCPYHQQNHDFALSFYSALMWVIMDSSAWLWVRLFKDLRVPYVVLESSQQARCFQGRVSFMVLPPIDGWWPWVNRECSTAAMVLAFHTTPSCATMEWRRQHNAIQSNVIHRNNKDGVPPGRHEVTPWAYKTNLLLDCENNICHSNVDAWMEVFFIQWFPFSRNL